MSNPHRIARARRSLVQLDRTTTALHLAVLLTAAGPLAVAEAARIDVPCSVPALVNAINTANASGERTTLDLADDCTYTLTAVAAPPVTGLPFMTGQIKINGNDATIAPQRVARDAGLPDHARPRRR